VVLDPDFPHQGPNVVEFLVALAVDGQDLLRQAVDEGKLRRY
jgi:hypothetical protein